MKQNYDVAVIGGGHAGCEAALASARMGTSTVLITLEPQKIAEMSCNPSIGGVGKGQLVKEIDALGGEMGKNADFTGIQFKRLNTRKGSAVQSSRCQSDKKKYAERMRDILKAQDNLDIVSGEVKRVLIFGARVHGVEIEFEGERFEVETTCIVITTGTFMRGLMHSGETVTAGGRFGEDSSQGLSDNLKDLGLSLLRLKTGTPPRLIRDSIDFSKMEIQYGDENPRRFSFFESTICLPQVPCYLSRTTENTHEIIKNNLNRSPLYSGLIKGIGPRYCPSIEDKVVKFPQRTSHHLFFEPESLETNWIYPNGISTSLPSDIQHKFVKTIPGCENVEFARYGYAVEYDCIDPKQLKSTLECKKIDRLFMAGQINGTSGYEEAAAQGLLAGINASLLATNEEQIVLGRSQSYIGVMVDDLVSLGITEPYRMFTSRAEYRLSIREDNADLRLSEIGRRISLLSSGDYERVKDREKTINYWKEWLSKEYLKPSKSVDIKLKELGSSGIEYPQSLSQLLKRPELTLENILGLSTSTQIQLDPSAAETIEVEVKYDGYIKIQLDEIARLTKMHEYLIPIGFDFNAVAGLSRELKEKLDKIRPNSLGEASIVSGITPSALTAILFHLRRVVSAVA